MYGMKFFKGLILFFVLSAGCIGDNTQAQDKTTSVQRQATPAAASKFSLTSTAFQNGSAIPAKYTCSGKDVSPPLSWAVPEGAKSLVLIVDDPDAPGGIFTHWVMYDIPPGVTGLPEGVAGSDRIAGGGTHGLNDFDGKGYGGPCPPAGKPHTYRFILYALDLELGMKPGATREEVLNAMKGHILSIAELDGKYGR